MSRLKILMVSVATLVATAATQSSCAEKPAAVSLQPVVSGLSKPVHLTHDGTARLFVVEQAGTIRLVLNGKLQDTPFLDIRSRVYSGASECGLLSVAFHPKFAQTGRFFVNYTTGKPSELYTIVSEFSADPRAGTASPDKERVILRIRQPYANHNGGQIAFGPDGFLYIGMGDGGSGGDPHGHGQNPRTMLAKMLRIDVDRADSGTAYGIPKDNPFTGRDGFLPEIWALGLRNPWRFSFDRKTGLCYAGDVGQNKWEEIDIIEKGGNYGWNIMEGMHPYRIAPSQGTLTPPIKEYTRHEGISVTGGFVYRGGKIPALQGWYVYGDYGSFRIWALHYENGRLAGDDLLLQTNMPISSFGEDKDGEIYVLDHARGNVHRLVPSW